MTQGPGWGLLSFVLPRAFVLSICAFSPFLLARSAFAFTVRSSAFLADRSAFPYWRLVLGPGSVFFFLAPPVPFPLS